MDALQIVVQDVDSAIEQRAHRKESFFLSVDQVLGRPARKEPEDFVGHGIAPIPHLVAESGVLFFRFFRHLALLCFQLYQKGGQITFRVKMCFDSKHILTRKVICPPFWHLSSQDSARFAGPADAEGVSLRVWQEKYQCYQPETEEQAECEEQKAADSQIQNARHHGQSDSGYRHNDA